jgi:type IV pilus assembly protein PilM
MGGMQKIINSSKTLFFEDQPIFGLDIGHDTLRVMQLDLSHKLPKLVGYGSVAYESSAIADGIILKPELIAKSAMSLFSRGLVGDITTKRVALSLPASRSFTHAVLLPKMNPKDIAEAVETEAEQYLPSSVENLYLDFTTLSETDEGIEVFVAAIPKQIVDSYLVLSSLLGLEAVLLDSAIGASARLFALDRRSDIPSVLIDFGAESTDISVFNHNLVVTGTAAFGGDDITKAVAQTLNISDRDATMIKSKYGLAASDVRAEVVTAIQPSLELLLKEIRRTIRYYEQRYTKESPIGQVVTMGGGANMPGMADYLTEQLRLPVRALNLPSYVEFGELKPFHYTDRMSYVTAAGLALTNPSEVFS